MSTNPINPYHPPQADVDPTSLQRSYAYCPEASKGTRLANLLLDYFGCLIIVMITLILIEFMNPGFIDGDSNPLVDQIVSWLAMLIYYVSFEAALGRTPAKFVTGTLVLSSERTKPTFGQIIGRTFSRFVPLDPFTFLGSDRGWHDRWSGTCVVKIRGQH